MKKLLIALCLACLLCTGAAAADYAALTFDDGPSGENTEALLQMLEEKNVHATFFLCGYRMDTYPELVKQLQEAGHELGVHGYSHTCFDRMDPAKLHAELQTTRDQIENLTGHCPTLVRPPCGVFNDTVRREAAEAGLSVILWSVDPQDWRCSDPCELCRRVCAKATGGSVILLHDMHQSSVEAAEKIIDSLSEQGFSFVTVSELAELTGHSLCPGEVYGRFSCAAE